MGESGFRERLTLTLKSHTFIEILNSRLRMQDCHAALQAMEQMIHDGPAGTFPSTLLHDGNPLNLVNAGRIGAQARAADGSGAVHQQEMLAKEVLAVPLIGGGDALLVAEDCLADVPHRGHGRFIINAESGDGEGHGAYLSSQDGTGRSLDRRKAGLNSLL